MRKTIALGACALTVIGAGMAYAGPLPPNGLDGDGRGWFYNRPGATPTEMKFDLDECREFGHNMAINVLSAGSVSAALAPYGFVGGFVGALMEAGAEASLEVGARRAYADDCMMGRGYRRFNTSDENINAFMERYAAMDEAAQSALSGSETPPEGVLAREWVNSYWIPADGDPARAPRQRIAVSYAFVGRVDTQVVRPIEAGGAIRLGPNDAVVVMSLRFEGAIGERASITFTRDNPETGAPETTPMGRRQRPQWPVVEARSERSRSSRESGSTTQMAFVVPAGVYGLGAAASGTTVTQFCLGTIAFTVEPGQALHLGEFFLRAQGSVASAHAPPAPFGLRIDAPNLEVGRATIASAPELAARLQTVSFQNGFVRACHGEGGGTPPVYGFDHPAGAWPQPEARTDAQAVAPAQTASEAAPAPAVDTPAAPVEP